MKTNKVLMALLAIVIFAAGSLSAQPKHRMGPKIDLKNQLNLTDQQQSKIESLRSDHQKRMVDLKSDLEKSMIELRDLKNKGNYSRNDFLSITDKISKIRDSISKERASHRMDVYDQLTAEQKKTFDKMPMGKGQGKHPGNLRKGRGGEGLGMGNNNNCPNMD